MEPCQATKRFGSDYEITTFIDSLTIWIKHLPTGRVYALEINEKVVKMLRLKIRSPEHARDTLFGCFDQPEGIQIILNDGELNISIADSLIEEEDPRGMNFPFSAHFHHQGQNRRDKTQEKLNEEHVRIPHYLKEYIWDLQDQAGDQRLQFSAEDKKSLEKETKSNSNSSDLKSIFGDQAEKKAILISEGYDSVGVGASNLTLSQGLYASFEERKVGIIPLQNGGTYQENSTSGLNVFYSSEKSSTNVEMGFLYANVSSNSSTNSAFNNILAVLRFQDGIPSIATGHSTNGSGSGSGSGNKENSGILASNFSG